MSLLPLITYQSRTSALSRSQRAQATLNGGVSDNGFVALQASCTPCVAGITVCCELTGFPPRLECNPRPC